jgi:lipoprotein-anchoring transpeptidase ErfK/SrfK
MRGMPALDAAVVAIASFVTAAPGGAEVVRPADAGRIAVRDAPGGAIVTELRARTPYGSPTRLWVRDRRPGWELVPAADAPGGAGWIADAATRPAPRRPRRIVIDVSASRLTVLGGGRRWSTRVIVGGASSPTPPGIYQVTDSLPGKRFNGVYGARILALSAYGSPRRTSRLALHGYPPAARSTTESAGCVRVPDAALARLTREAPPGTPVRIRA